MDAAQAGMLAGVRPMIEYLATPFWNKIANKFQKGKAMLLVAVASWIIFTLPIGFIHPPVVSCKYWNGSSFLLELPSQRQQPSSEWEHERQKRSIFDSEETLTPDTVDELPRALPIQS